MTRQPETLAAALPKEMERVREHLIPMYESIGPAGSIAIMFMRQALDRAMKALAEQDTVQMVRSLEELREFKE